MYIRSQTVDNLNFNFLQGEHVNSWVKSELPMVLDVKTQDIPKALHISSFACFVFFFFSPVFHSPPHKPFLKNCFPKRFLIFWSALVFLSINEHREIGRGWVVD